MMKKILVFLCFIGLSQAQAHDLGPNKTLLQASLNAIVETYGQLIADTMDYQRDLKKSLPLMVRKKKIRKSACDSIEMTTTYSNSLLEDTKNDIKGDESQSAQVFNESLVGILDHSKKAHEKCEELDEAIEFLQAVERDANSTLDMINHLED